MSKLPNLADLVKIEELSKQVKQLLAQREDLQKAVENIKTNQPEMLEAKLEQAVNSQREIISRQADSKMIQEASQTEVDLKTSIATTISEAIDKFLESDDYTKLIKNVLAKLDAGKNKYSIIVSKELKKYLPKGVESKTVKEQVLRIHTDTKAYILDPQELKSYLMVDLINQVVPSIAK